MYIGLLDRLLDAGGLAYYEAILDAAYASNGIEGVRAQARNMGAQLIGSVEYQSTNPSNAMHVVRLYRA